MVCGVQGPKGNGQGSEALVREARLAVMRQVNALTRCRGIAHTFVQWFRFTKSGVIAPAVPTPTAMQASTLAMHAGTPWQARAFCRF